MFNVTKNIVFIGGGHTHSIVLNLLGKCPLSKVRLILITPDIYTPYSGMLPGHIAGFYSYSQCHINLQYLSNFAGSELYLDYVVGLDLKNNYVLCANKEPVSFDVLSIDIGSVPKQLSVLVGSEYTIGVKPVSRFLKCWYSVQENIWNNCDKSFSIAVVGGGAGGVELVLSMIRGLQGESCLKLPNVEFHLFHSGISLMPNYYYLVGEFMQELLLSKGVNLHLKERVCEVIKMIDDRLNVKCESGLMLSCDYVFLVSQPSAASWVKDSGIATNDDGFILVNNALQSVSHHHIFAAGDIASMINYNLPKSGVFAVRQSKTLYDNLRRIIDDQPLKSYKPQSSYLSLIGTGDGKAIATKGNFTLPPHKLLWCWKDFIDRRFMEQFPQ